MYKGKTVIDVHGHMSTPPHFRAHAYNLIALRTPGEGAAEIPEAAMKAALDRHLRLLDERNVDVQLISPRPVAMMHWERPFLVEAWTTTTNDVIAQQCALHPKRFVGVAQLPQTPDLNIRACVAELERCIEKLGFVGALLNPDPGGDRRAPGLDSSEWFPLYECAQALKATLVVHPSLSRDPRIERIPHSYQYNNLTEETLATLLLEYSDVFQRFPNLKVVVCHCGGSPRRLLEKGDVLDATNPSRAYDPWYLAAAIRQRGANRMVFGTESPGAGTAVLNPMTGKAADDILATLSQFDFLSDEDRIDIVHNNPARVFPLLEGKEAVTCAR
jgi:predicted TIM-barrel fold metal-dependent hydrolase